MKLKRTLAILLAAAMITASLAACGSSDSGQSDGGSSTPSSTDSGSSDSGNTDSSTPADSGSSTGSDHLNVVMQFDATLSTVADSYSGCWFPMRMGYSEALTKVASDGSITSWLASDWEMSDDARTWVFTIRDDVCFSNGTPLTATKVVDAINHLYDYNDPANGGPDALVNFMVRPASIVADDAAYTVTFTFDDPVYNVAGALSNPAFGIIDWEASADMDYATQGEIGTGPYVVASTVAGHSVEMVANEYYYEDVPYATVTILSMADSSAMSYALQDGSADMACNLSMSDITNLEGIGGYECHTAYGARDGFYFINFNGIMSNDDVRHAVLMAVDWETIDNITVGGSYIPGFAMISPVYGNYGSASIDNPWAYDPAGAIALLDAAGIVDSDGDGIREVDGENVQIVIATNSSRQMDIMADAMVPMIQEVGLGAVHNLVEDQTEPLSSGACDLANWNQVIMQTGDPSNFLRQWVSDSSNNYGHYSNPEYDALYAQLISMQADSEEAYEIVKQMQTIIAEDGAFDNAGYFVFNLCNSVNITGVVCNGTADYYWITNDIMPA